MKSVFSLFVLLLLTLLSAGSAHAETATACMSGDKVWSEHVAALLQSRVAQAYEKLDVQASRAVPALKDVNLSLQSPWPAGRVAVAIEGRECDSGTLSRQVVWFRAQAYRQAWVYGRAAKAEHPLAETAPEKMLIDVAALHLPDAELLPMPGAEVLARAVTAGAPLRRSDVKTAPLVNRNAEVTVVVQGKGLLVRTRGTAMQFGAEGDWIPVMVAGAAKSTRARVIAPGVVHVDI